MLLTDALALANAELEEDRLEPLILRWGNYEDAMRQYDAHDPPPCNSCTLYQQCMLERLACVEFARYADYLFEESLSPDEAFESLTLADREPVRWTYTKLYSDDGELDAPTNAHWIDALFRRWGAPPADFIPLDFPQTESI